MLMVSRAGVVVVLVGVGGGISVGDHVLLVCSYCVRSV